MFESIGRSLLLVKTSWGILMQDKKLLSFPVMSGIVSLIVLATFIAPLFFAGLLSETVVRTDPVVFYGALFVFYVVSYFVVIFFNTALITCVYARLNGREMSIGQALSGAVSHLPAILAWALVSATVGLLLQVLHDKAGFVGEIAAALIGGVWGLVTFFVVPVLIIEDKGVIEAMKESVSLIKKTWGESIVGSGSIMIIFLLIGMVAFVLTLATIALDNTVVFWIAAFLFVIVVLILAVVGSAMQGIFVTALYMYAKTGTVPSAFSSELIEKAFVPKTGVKQGIV